MTVPHPNLALMRGVPTIFLDENFAALDGALGSSSNNLMLNGDLRFWRQNGPTVGVPLGTVRHGPDMIAGQCVGSSISMTRGQTSLGDYPGQPRYYMGVSVSSVAGAANFARLLLYFEDVRIFAGQTLTLAFKSNSVSAGVAAVSTRQYFGTGGAPSADVDTYAATVAFSSGVLEEQSITFTVPPINGKTIGSNEDSTFSIAIWLDAGSTFDAITNTLGQHTFSLNMWDFRLNFGSLSIARNVPIDIGTRYLALCRYYFKTFFNDTAPATNIGTNTGEFLFPQVVGASAAMQCPGLYFPSTMWKTPTITLFSPDAVANVPTTETIGVWTGVASTISRRHVSLVGNTPIGSSPGFTCGVHVVADALPVN